MNDFANTKPLIIWRFLDGKVGHEKQSQALIEGLSTQRELTSLDIELEYCSFNYWVRWIFNQGVGIEKGDKPDIIIGTGHLTHLAILAAKRYYGCKAIVIMSPSLPFWLFDVIVAPQHDFLDKAKPSNVITTLTALASPINSIPDSKKGLILLGGISKHFEWDDEIICQKIKSIIDSLPSDIHWQVSSSRRTPYSSLPALKTLCKSIGNITLFDHNELSADWLEIQFRTKGHILITEDSVSMIAEALNTRANLYIIQLQTKKSKNKLKSTISALASKNLIGFEVDSEKKLKRNREPLNQQNLCAKIILEKYLQREL